MEADEAGHISLQRYLLLEVCGAVSVRSLRVPATCEAQLGGGLPDVFCELWRGDLLVYRSGLVHRSLNPTWTLRSRVSRSHWPDIGAEEDQIAWTEPLRLRVRILLRPNMVEARSCSEDAKPLQNQQNLDETNFGFENWTNLRNMGNLRSTASRGGGRGSAECCSEERMDAYPYHHDQEPDEDACVTVLERTVHVDQLQSTGLTTSEMHMLDTKGPNEVFIGIWPGNLPHVERTSTLSVNITPAKVAAAAGAVQDTVTTDSVKGDDATLPVWKVGKRTSNFRSGQNMMAFRLPGDNLDDVSRPSAPSVNDLIPTNGATERSHTKVLSEALPLPSKAQLVQVLGGKEVYEKMLHNVQVLLQKQAAVNELESKVTQLLESKATLLRDNVERHAQKRRVEKLRLARDHLAGIYDDEREALKKRKQALVKRLEDITKGQEILAKYEEIHARNEAVQSEEEVARRALAKERVLMRVHRISMLRALSRIYPLQERYTDTGVWVYTIRGLQVPAVPMDPALLGTFEEEQVSTALGYLAHFVSLLSKYVDIPIRYLPLPHSSSSTICDPLIVCAETPHEPMTRSTHHQTSLASSFPQHIFGSASGRLGRVLARRALSNGTFPLYWKTLSKNLRPRFSQAVDILARDVQLLAFVHALRSNTNTPLAKQHMLAQLKTIFDDFGSRVSSMQPQSTPITPQTPPP